MKARTRTYAALLTGLLLIPGLFLQAKAGSISAGSGAGVEASHYRPPSNPNTTTVMNEIRRQTQSIEDFLEQIRALVQTVNAEMANKLQKPDTSGKSKEQAAKQQAQYEKALAMWGQRLTNLQRKIVALQRKIAVAEARLRRLQNVDMPAAQRKDRQQQQRYAQAEINKENARQRRRTTRPENRRPVVDRPEVKTEVRKTLAKSRKQQQGVARLLRRLRGVLRPQPGRKPSAGSAAQTPALSGSGTPPAQ